MSSENIPPDPELRLKHDCTSPAFLQSMPQAHAENQHLMGRVMLRGLPAHCLRRVSQLLEPHVRRGALFLQQRMGVQIQPRPLTTRGVCRLRSVAGSSEHSHESEQCAPETPKLDSQHYHLVHGNVRYHCNLVVFAIAQYQCP